MIKYPPPAFAWGVMASPQLPWWLWWWLVGDAALSRLHERVVVWWVTRPSRVCTRGWWWWLVGDVALSCLHERVVVVVGGW